MVKIKSSEPHQVEAHSFSLASSAAPKGIEKLFELAQKGMEREVRIAPNSTTRQQSISLDEFETFPEFHEKRPNISQNQLEWIYRHRKQNGFAKAFKKIGKLRYVVVPVFTAVLLGDEGND